MEKQPTSKEAFETALKVGHLSHDTSAPNYVGHFMFMGRADGIDYFKHRETRKYQNHNIADMPVDLTELRDKLREEIAASGGC